MVRHLAGCISPAGAVSRETIRGAENLSTFGALYQHLTGQLGDLMGGKEAMPGW